MVLGDLGTVGVGWGDLGTVEMGWGDLGIVGVGWGDLGTVHVGWGDLDTVGVGVTLVQCMWDGTEASTLYWPRSVLIIVSGADYKW